MSEPDQDRVIGRLTKRLFWRMGVPIMVILVGQFVLNSMKASDKYVEKHYSELYKLTAELATTQAMYMKATDEDKEKLWERMNYIIERMDKFADHDVNRGIVEKEEREYGLEFTPLLQ